MSFSARVFRILIASPSDVTDEREIAVGTIQAWNDLNSGERQIVLLPLRWETHSAPEYGRRPQEVINRQVVDHSDLLVGIFWTRVGSPTGAADSGTLEEIERVASLGKPVMLYFSQVKQDPDRIDIAQLTKLRHFKEKTFPKALVETYTSQIEFRDKLSKQLEIQLRTLLSEENQKDGGVTPSSPTTEIQFEFAHTRTGKLMGAKLELHNTVIELEGLEDLPDYATESDDRQVSTDTGTVWVHMDKTNKDFYREMATYLVRQNFYHPIRFWMKNVGGVGARDVYVDIRIVSEDADLVISTLRDADLKPPSKSGLHFYGGSSWSGEDSNSPPEQIGKQWTTQLELRALQPQREVSPPPKIVLGAKQSGTVIVTARIYADTLPEPVTRTLQIDWTSKTIRKNALDFLKEAGVAVSLPNGGKEKRISR
jgi:hypothetical protein